MAYSPSAAQAIREIGRLQATLQRLAALPRRTAALAQPGINRLLQRQFADGKDPYGRPWAPLAKSTLARGRRPPPLTASRTLRRGTKALLARANYAGLRLVLGAPYGYFHQVGFRGPKRKTPSRRILPQFGIPKAWREVLDRAAARTAQEARR